MPPRKDFRLCFARLLADAEGHSLKVARATMVFEDQLIVYMRVGPRSVDRQPVFCLQIANLNTRNEEQTGQGRFKRFLIEARSMTLLPFYVEGAERTRFSPGLLRLGFRIVRTDEFGTSDFFRLT